MIKLPTGEENYQKIQAELVFLTDSIIYRKHSDKGIVEYEVSASDIKAAFADTRFSTGLLPPNTIYYGVEGENVKIALYIPPTRVSVSAEIDDKKKLFVIPTPPLIFCGIGREYRIFALCSPNIEFCTRLSVAPFPNVNTNGIICFGEHNIAPACNPKNILIAKDMFFSSIFNKDLSEKKCQSGNIFALWKKINGKRKFPVKELIEYDADIKNFISFMEGGQKSE